MITVYSKKPCVQCDATKRWLKDADVEWQEVQLTDELIAQFKERGLSSAPVVDMNGSWHAGFEPDKLPEKKKKV